MADSNNKGVIIIVGILSLMMIIPIIATGGPVLAILFIILAIIGLKFISSSKSDGPISTDPFQTIHPGIQKQSLREETWSEAIKNLLGWLLVWTVPAALAWIYFLW